MSGVVRSLSAIIIGLLLIFLKDSVMPFMVRLVGVAFFLPALLSVINIYTTRKGAVLFPMVLITLVDIGSMILGLWLIISPVAFIELFVIMLAIVVLCFSLYQIYAVFSSYRYLPTPWGLLITPLALVVLSVVMLANPFGSLTTAILVLGICTVVSGVSDILIYVLKRRIISKDVEIVD